jgi:intracellular sulfur oxidation DsrE/DsrF family protein
MTETRGNAEARAVWDFTIGEPDKFAMRLEDMRDTMRAFAQRGMKPRFAMIVRGPASKLIMRSPPSPSTPELQKAAARIAPLLEELAGQGLFVEQCGVALGRQGVRREDLLSLVTVIENSFVSIVDYELQGYAYVPVDR